MTKLKETKTAFAARAALTPGRISQLIAAGLPVQSDGRIFGGRAGPSRQPTTSRGCANGSMTRWRRLMRVIGFIGCRWAGGRRR